ncbi:MAG: HD domain-containing protein, partial [Steroidobacteraceae bacterium]
RLEHSLQTATRAHRDGRDDEYVACALIHDIGDSLGSFNHADIATAILKPFVSEQNLWMVEQHAIFQGYYFFEHMGLDKNLRDRFRGHEWFDYTAEFCEKYDQCSFDPSYDSMRLEEFEPLLRRFFARPRRSIYLRSG